MRFGTGSDDVADFGAVKGPGLSVPPDFNLRPPAPGTGDNKQAASEVARSRVFNIPANGSTANSQGGLLSRDGATPGEQAFLRRLGVAATDPQIRAIVDHETAALEQSEKLFVDKLLKWRDEAPDEADGQDGESAITEEAAGETSPVTIKKSKGLLESVF